MSILGFPGDSPQLHAPCVRASKDIALDRNMLRRSCLEKYQANYNSKENELWHPCQGFFLFSFGNFNVFGSQYFSAFPCSYLVPGWPCDHETRRGPKPSMYVRCRFLHMYLHKHHPIHFSVHMCKGVYLYIHLYSNLSSMSQLYIGIEGKEHS